VWGRSPGETARKAARLRLDAFKTNVFEVIFDVNSFDTKQQ